MPGQARTADVRRQVLARRRRYDQMVEELEREAIAELGAVLDIPERDVWQIWHEV